MQNRLVEIRSSMGCTRSGCCEKVYFIRPKIQCGNRSRRIVGEDRLHKAIERWYAPEINLYLIEDRKIASNSEVNALREYWRVCEIEDSRKPFAVTLLQKNACR